MTDDNKLHEELIDFLINNGFEKWLNPTTRESIYAKGLIRVKIWCADGTHVD